MACNLSYQKLVLGYQVIMNNFKRKFCEQKQTFSVEAVLPVN